MQWDGQWEALTSQQKNKIIAEKVFKYNVEVWEGTSALLVVNDKAPGGYDRLPNYSEDIGDAWMIVEHFKTPEAPQDGFYRYLRSFCEPNPLDVTKTYHWWIYGVTPDRICKSALKALNVNIDTQEE